MEHLAQFREAVDAAMTLTLATAGKDGSVTQRLVSPVWYGDEILIFTAPDSLKYRQLRENPRCCVGAGSCFVQATATFCGATMADENEPYRRAYAAKFAGAFDEGVAFGGTGADFVLLKPTRLTGWAFENDDPAPDAIPTIPFAIDL